MSGFTDEQIEALCERLDRVEYNQGVPKNAPWLTRQGLSSSASWGIHQPLGKFGLFLIIAREVGEPFAEFIAAARSLVPSLLERAQKAEAENRRLIAERAANEKANVESRRSICEQSDRYKAERDALAAKLRAVEDWADGWWDDTTPEATEPEPCDNGPLVTRPHDCPQPVCSCALGALPPCPERSR